LKHLKDSIYVDAKKVGDAIESNGKEINVDEKDDLDNFVEKIRQQQAKSNK
jgi:hypothetical protein